MKQIKPLMQREKPRHRAFNDIEGETFGRLKVVSYAGYRSKPSGRNVNYWNCICKCGKRCIVMHLSIFRGTTLSCGCLRIEKITKHGNTLGGKVTAEYQSYLVMKNKILNPKFHHYKHYGGRGIYICDRWLYSPDGFDNFLADMGPRPRGMILGRRDKDGNYDPNNCRWMTLVEAVAGGNTRLSQARVEVLKRRVNRIEIGAIFGRLTVVSHEGTNKHQKRIWRCRCECGNECVTVGSKLISRGTRSCGCARRDTLAALGEARRGGLRRFSSVAELMADLNEDEDPS